MKDLELQDVLSVKRDVEELRSQESIIYFLLDGDEIVYVGQSNKGLSRIYSHIYEGKKVFNGYSVISCEEKLLNETEAFFIMKFKPKYNKVLPRCRSYVNVYGFTTPGKAKKVLECGCDSFKAYEHAVFMAKQDFIDCFYKVTGINIEKRVNKELSAKSYA